MDHTRMRHIYAKGLQRLLLLRGLPSSSTHTRTAYFKLRLPQCRSRLCLQRVAVERVVPVVRNRLRTLRGCRPFHPTSILPISTRIFAFQRTAGRALV